MASIPIGLLLGFFIGLGCLGMPQASAALPARLLGRGGYVEDHSSVDPYEIEQDAQSALGVGTYFRGGNERLGVSSSLEHEGCFIQPACPRMLVEEIGGDVGRDLLGEA